MSAGRALALLLCLSPTLAVATESPRRPIDPARSQATFSVRKLWFAHARGTFPNLRGTVRRIEADGNPCVEVDANVAVAGLVMGNVKDRARALGAAFFDAARFATIRFASAPLPVAELATGGRLRGTLLLHGVRRKVVFQLRPSTCPRRPLACAIHVDGTLSRRAFGMDARRALVGNKVTLTLRIVLAPWP